MTISNDLTLTCAKIESLEDISEESLLP